MDCNQGACHTLNAGYGVQVGTRVPGAGGARAGGVDWPVVVGEWLLCEIEVAFPD